MNDYDRNMLNGIADWLLTRSEAVWAKRSGYSGLMRTWGEFVRDYLRRVDA